MEEGAHLAESLLALPAEEREGWLAQHPEALAYHTFLDLIRGVAHAIGRDPRDAVALSELIVRHMDRVAVPPDSQILQMALHINGWRERGNALRNVGELPEARVAFDRGLALAQSNPALIVEEAIMQRGIGLLLHHAKDHEGALRAIRASIPIFQAINDQLQVLRSRLLEGFVEYNRGGNEVALHIFEETAELSRELGDAETRARSHTNAAHSARRLGMRDRALAHFTTAAELLQQCGLTAETIRAEWGFTLLEAGDDLGAIIPALDRIRDQFLATGRQIDAAWVSLDVVMLLRDADRHEEAIHLAISLFEFFMQHGLPEEAMRALKELRLAAEEGNLTTELLEEIQGRLLKV